MNKLKPVNDKIVVKTKSKEEEVTEGGILLPDTVDQGKLMEGEVVAVGQGMWSANGKLIPVICDVGDTILYSSHAMSQEYTLDNENLVIMSQNEVLSILEDLMEVLLDLQQK